MTFGICTILLVMMCVMRFWPDSTAGRMLNRQLVEMPLRRLGQLERHHLIFLLVIVGLMLAGVAGGEALAILGPDFAVIYALDVSLYIDGLLMALTLASVARSRSGFAATKAGTAWLAVRLRRVFGRRRVRSAPAKRIEKPSANDDDHPVFAMAA
jgi:hypothetical protein